MQHSALRCAKTFSLPLFLAPSFAGPLASRFNAQSRHASTTEDSSVPSRDLASTTDRSPPQKGRNKFNLALRSKNRDMNKKRGISAIRSTGPRRKTSIYKYPLPVPVIDPEKRTQFAVNEKHGLWGFFNEDKQTMLPAEDEGSFGRPWTYRELSVKDFDDLHKLFYTCVLEVNRISTRRQEMRRLRAGYGDYEAKERIRVCRRTMGDIRRVLADRHANFTEARNILATGGLLKDIFQEGEESASQGNDEYFMSEEKAKDEARSAETNALLR